MKTLPSLSKPSLSKRSAKLVTVLQVATPQIQRGGVQALPWIRQEAEASAEALTLT